MATQIGYISDLETIVTTDATCKKCGGLGYLQSFMSLPDGGICYRCDGLGVNAKDAKPKTTAVETTKPLNVTFMEDGQTFEDLLQSRAAAATTADRQVAKFNETGDLFDLFR
jgi:DnaJ-class molecular chaperone